MSSDWKGSTQTLTHVAHQIEERFGVEAVKEYDPTLNCFTYKGWKERGFQVRKGEKGVKSVTFIPGKKKDKKGNESDAVYPKSITLFWKSQVEPIDEKE
jgi:antirestriction factor ArdC-like protein